MMKWAQIRISLIFLCFLASALWIHFQYNLGRYQQSWIEDQRKTLDHVSREYNHHFRQKVSGISEKSRHFTQDIFGRKRTRKRQIRFYQELIEKKGEIFSISHFKKTDKKKGKWSANFRLTHRKKSEGYLKKETLADLDSQSKKRFSFAAEGKIDLIGIKTKDRASLIRLLVPYGKEKNGKFNELLAIDLHPKAFSSTPSDQELQSFSVDRENQFLASIRSSQSDIYPRYKVSDRLDHLPVFRLFNRTQRESANLQYQSLPGAIPMISSLQMTGIGNIKVVTQKSLEPLYRQVQDIKSKNYLFMILCVGLIALCAFFIISRQKNTELSVSTP